MRSSRAWRGKLVAGHRDQALAELENALDDMQQEQLRALGELDSSSNAELRSLRESLEAPEAALPAERNRLGKKLLEEGRDARRVGAKRGPDDGRTETPR